MSKSLSVILKTLFVILTAASVFFVWRGVYMQARAIGESGLFSDLQQQYYTIAPDARNRASADSDLNKAYIRIQQYPSQLAAMQNVGLGMILTGVYIFAIAALLIVALPKKGKYQSR